jgi:hypothetical protein
MEEKTSKNSTPEMSRTIEGMNTDGRNRHDWKSKYTDEARKEMIKEAVYIGLILVLSFALLIFNFFGAFVALIKHFCGNPSKLKIAEYLIYFSSAGILGGSVYGIKYFYRVIAHGYWTQDRRYWRIFSPFVSMAIAFIVGIMVCAGLLKSNNNISNSWAIAFGFFSGYFADEAVGKMYEIATLVFGKTKKN